MNFFDYGDDRVATSNQIYIFVIVTVVVTVLAFALWQIFIRRARRLVMAREQQQQHQERPESMNWNARLVRENTFPAP